MILFNAKIGKHNYSFSLKHKFNLQTLSSAVLTSPSFLCNFSYLEMTSIYQLLDSESWFYAWTECCLYDVPASLVFALLGSQYAGTSGLISRVIPRNKNKLVKFLARFFSFVKLGGEFKFGLGHLLEWLFPDHALELLACRLKVIPCPVEGLYALIVRQIDIYEQLFEVGMLQAVLDRVAFLRVKHKHLL